MGQRDANERGFDRRSFVAGTAAAAAALSQSREIAFVSGGQAVVEKRAPEITDTNVHLFQWPFRSLKYDRTSALIQKLKRHRVTQAWAGSFEAILTKQLDRVNRRVAEECKANGVGMLMPIGCVNPTWPDWLEDLRHCHENYGMRGIRLYPAYHAYTLDHPGLAALLAEVQKRNMFLQIAIRLEDERVHLPVLAAPVVNTDPLADVLERVPKVRVQLLNADTALRGSRAKNIVEKHQVAFDISSIETQGGVGRLLNGVHVGYASKFPESQLFFGSHAPFFPCESALLKLFESPLSTPQLGAVMHENARRFLESPG